MDRNSDRAQTSFPELTSKDEEVLREIKRQSEQHEAQTLSADFPAHSDHSLRVGLK